MMKHNDNLCKTRKVDVGALLYRRACSQIFIIMFNLIWENDVTTYLT